ncbi:hypothetical protein [Echinicola sp. 20G]|uniref:hypothetical protein n=1 Tax=Echinicola sp. 20G TaxID=2781961 RepID=UPI0019100E23|nr:hypothetical protein [Echinicola sp. 20G]
MKALLLICFALLSQQPKSAFACICSSLTTSLANEMISDANLIVEGEYIKTIHFDENMERLLNKSDWGRNILFKVNKVHKGKVKSDTIAIYQHGGSCDRSFHKGEKYILLTNKIKSFKSVKLPHLKKEQSEDFQEPPPPPMEPTKNGKVRRYNVPKPFLDYWNNITENYTTVTISLCNSFIQDSDHGEFIEKELTKNL